jgi:hypothetical protein
VAAGALAGVGWVAGALVVGALVVVVEEGATGLGVEVDWVVVGLLAAVEEEVQAAMCPMRVDTSQRFQFLNREQQPRSTLCRHFGGCR